MLFVFVPVPGAQPAPAPIAGAQLVVPSGAGVAPGVVFVGVSIPGTGALVTPVVSVGEFTVGVVVGKGTGAPGVVVVVVVPAASAANTGEPPQSAATQPAASRRVRRTRFDICFMVALLSSTARAMERAVP